MMSSHQKNSGDALGYRCRVVVLCCSYLEGIISFCSQAELDSGQPNVLISALRFSTQTWVVKEVNANHNAELLVLCVCVVTLFSWFLLGKKMGVSFLE